MGEQFLIIILPLLLGYLLDLILGDPRWLWHPIRFFGNSIGLGQQLLNRKNHRFIKGMLLTLFLCTCTFVFFFLINRFLLSYSFTGYIIFNSIFIFYALANRSLLQEGKEVFHQLEFHGIDAGRKRLSWIVGRDTTTLTENQIRTAVFETLSENLSDGVIAPLFYYAVGGLPGMMTYKMVNTLDSMIGYKSEPYFYFGKFAARLDDIFNFIPSRITAFLMVLVTGSVRGLLFIFKYGHCHSSPNSGYPEAALAGILNCRFGGPNTYHGKLVQKPYIGNKERTIAQKEFQKISYINHSVTFLMILLISVTYFFIQ